MSGVPYVDAWDALRAEYPVSFDERAVVVAGTTTRVFSTGKGPDVILIPGAGATGASWLPLVPHMPGHRLHLVDLPGFGFGAPLAWDEGDPRDHASQIVDDLLAQVCPDGAALAGNSFGGWLLLAWALARPDKDLPVAVIGIAPGLRKGPVPVRTALRALEAHGVDHGPFFDELASRAGPVPRLFADPSRLSGAWRDLEKALWQEPHTRESWAAVLRAMLTERGEMAPAIDLTDELARRSRPFTYAFGTEDPYLDLLDPRPDLVPGASPVGVPGGGHLPWVERPRALARILGAV